MDGFIQLNLAKHFSVPQLARIVALSVPHFATLCRNTTGKPPMEYVRECRLWKAHAMVRTGCYRRREIARVCGFYDGSKKSSCIRWPRCWGCAHETEI